MAIESHHDESPRLHPSKAPQQPIMRIPTRFPSQQSHFVTQPIMPPKICLRRAKPSDLPAMLRTFIAAFSHGPWSGVLFPPHLRTSPNDEMNWRTRVAASALQQPGQTYMIAEEEEQGGQLVGWAQWTDAAARDASEKMTKEERWGSDAPPGLDLQAAEALGGEAEVVEEMVRGALGKERWGRAVGMFSLAFFALSSRTGMTYWRLF